MKYLFSSFNILYFFLLLLIFSITILIISENVIIFIILSCSLFGIFLFTNPIVCFWAILSAVFTIEFILSFFPVLTPIRWSVSVLSLIIGFRSFIAILSNNRNILLLLSNKTIVFLLIFFFLGIASSLLNHINSFNILVAIKNYFQFTPVILALSSFPYFDRHSFRYKIVFVLILFAILQVPVSLYQALSQGASLEYSKYNWDSVSGTLSALGASNELSFFIFFSIGLLLSLNKYSLIRYTTLSVLIFLLLIPIIFNETKMSFIFLPLTFLTIYKSEIYRLKIKVVYLLSICILMIFSLGYFYKLIYVGSHKPFIHYITESLEYNIGAKGYGKYRLNRTNALIFWYNKSKYFSVSDLLFGHGLDSSNEESNFSFANKGKIAARYSNYGIGITLVPRLLWDTGIFGTFCFFTILFSSYFNISKYVSHYEHELSNIDSSILLSLQAGILLCFAHSFMSPAFRNLTAYNFLIYLILGLTILLTSKNCTYESHNH